MSAKSVRTKIGEVWRLASLGSLYLDLEGKSGPSAFVTELPCIRDALTGELYAPALPLVAKPSRDVLLRGAEIVNCSFTGCHGAWDVPLSHVPGQGYSGEPLLPRNEAALRFGRPRPSYTESLPSLAKAYPALGP